MRYLLGILLFVSFSCVAQQPEKAAQPSIENIAIGPLPANSQVPARDLNSPDAVYQPNEARTIAQYKDGIDALFLFISKNTDTSNITLPKQAKLVAYMSFIIEKNGSISNIKILRNPGQGAGEAVAKAIAKSSPNWIPAVNNKGETVRMELKMPFQI